MAKTNAAESEKGDKMKYVLEPDALVKLAVLFIIATQEETLETLKVW